MGKVKGFRLHGLGKSKWWGGDLGGAGSMWLS